MGSIGHNTLLYTLNNWQVRAAVRGYFRTHRPAWESSRFNAFVLACALGCDIKSTRDIIQFSWEGQETPTEEDIEKLTRLLEEARAHNAAIEKAAHD